MNDEACSSSSKKRTSLSLHDEGKPPTKQLKLTGFLPENSNASKAKEKLSLYESHASIYGTLNKKRHEIAKSVVEFKFNKKRVRILSANDEFPSTVRTVLYWMSRDQRVQDNWAFLYAQRLALMNKAKLLVAFCLVPKFLDATLRQFSFMLKGLEEVEEECEKLNIPFHLLRGYAKDCIPDFVHKMHVDGLVCDFSPLRVPQKWVKDVQTALPANIPFCQVDAHNVVPVWHASPKLEYAARTIRTKINNQKNEYLTEFPPLISHPFNEKNLMNKNNWKAALKSLEVDESVADVDWAKPGCKAGLAVLDEFCQRRLKSYNLGRNDPTLNALSNLSPWFHFGQISTQRSILEVESYRKSNKESVEAFVEETLIRRELADNFCFYNNDYDKLQGAWEWAQKTLNDHRKDKRDYIYSKSQLDQAKTHDNLWNASQIQLRLEGKLHGFLRMYWAKKILEWTESPEKALEIAIYLNDRYNLDGRDPNGYVGCMWSICGIHDQGWKERAVFGKIRYMNYAGCQRKFNVGAFVAKYSHL